MSSQSDLGIRESHRADHPECHCMPFAGQPSQEGSVEGMSFLNNLISFCDHPVKWVIQLKDGEKPLNIAYWDINKAFDNISYSILLENLGVHVLDGSAAHWVKKWLDDWAESVGEWSYIQLVASNYSFPRDQHWDHAL